jgi:hypothetical protein
MQTRFRRVWCLDFEFIEPKGEKPDPLCMVAIELVSGREIVLWRDELHQQRRPPFDLDCDTLFVAYAAVAELKCFVVLGWQFPVHVLDLFFEFRARNNTVKPAAGGLLEALAFFGLAHILPARKEAMRDRILSGPPFTSDEQRAILDYCREDVLAVARLLPAITAGLHWPQALLRGRYAGAVARMELAGVPIDTVRWHMLVDHWGELRHRLIRAVDRRYGLFEGETFKADRFARWLYHEAIPWPFYPSGQPMLEARLFRDMSAAYPKLGPLHQLRQSLGKLRLTGLTVGQNGFNRCALHPFRSVSGRNQPRIRNTSSARRHGCAP